MATYAPDGDSRRSLVLHWRPRDVHRPLGGLVATTRFAQNLERPDYAQAGGDPIHFQFYSGPNTRAMFTHDCISFAGAGRPTRTCMVQEAVRTVIPNKTWLCLYAGLCILQALRGVSLHAVHVPSRFARCASYDRPMIIRLPSDDHLRILIRPSEDSQRIIGWSSEDPL